MCTSCVWLLVVAILFLIFTLWEIWYLTYVALKKARESEILVKLLWTSLKSTKKNSKITDLSDAPN